MTEVFLEKSCRVDPGEKARGGGGGGEFGSSTTKYYKREKERFCLTMLNKIKINKTNVVSFFISQTESS